MEIRAAWVVLAFLIRPEGHEFHDEMRDVLGIAASKTCDVGRVQIQDLRAELPHRLGADRLRQGRLMADGPCSVGTPNSG